MLYLFSRTIFWVTRSPSSIILHLLNACKHYPTPSTICQHEFVMSMPVAWLQCMLQALNVTFPVPCSFVPNWVLFLVTPHIFSRACALCPALSMSSNYVRQLLQLQSQAESKFIFGIERCSEWFSSQCPDVWSHLGKWRRAEWNASCWRR